MKHLLNFEPPVKFRKGSSFMFQTILCLLYALPIVMGLVVAFNYFHLESLIAQTTEAMEALEKRHAQFARQMAEVRGEIGDLKADEERLVSYHRLLAGLSFSWTRLLGILEGILPEGVRLVRIRIRPQSVVKIFLEGQATELGQVTDLLRKFYALDRFVAPRLSRHTREETPNGALVGFTLDVDYLPKLEVRP